MSDSTGVVVALVTAGTSGFVVGLAVGAIFL